MILKRELAKSEQELITPATEVAGVDVEDDRDEVTDVGDGDCLRMQIQEGSSLVKEQGLSWRGIGRRRRGRGGRGTVEGRRASTARQGAGVLGQQKVDPGENPDP